MNSLLGAVLFVVYSPPIDWEVSWLVETIFDPPMNADFLPSFLFFQWVWVLGIQARLEIQDSRLPQPPRPATLWKLPAPNALLVS